ncbi:MAG: CDP-glycerol glycerophosphotransferase family protein [Bacilli bacterium]|nr:CDP-glycerol glycerophosphotransferase family protein [Bacilli bacterium]
MKQILKNLKYIKLTDLISPFIFIFVLPISIIFRVYNKLKKQKIWLICEDGYHARDNGYHFYKYLKENHPELESYYVIDKKEKDYVKIKKYNNIIQFKSFKHWVYYLSCDLNISSQKNGNPAQPLFYILHVYLNLFNNRVFLQHGVIKDYCEWLIYKNTKFKYFICGAKKEFEYIASTYGYPKGSVIYTGLARFDGLHNVKVNKKQILIMPTWRIWLGRDTNSLGQKFDFVDTDFYKNWNNLLTDKKMINYIEKNKINILFYPHIDMQKFLYKFKSKSKNIKFLDLNTDIQKVLKESALLITDYSSVFMDFGYMRKPIIYFQFDKKEFRRRQYQRGYFSYKNDGFGPVINRENKVVDKILEYIQNDFVIESMYKTRMDQFFELNDSKNCERIYQEINKN